MKIAAFLVVAGLACAADAGVYTGPGGAIPGRAFGGAADPGVLASSIVVANDVDFPITAVTVSLQGFTHTFAGDVIATLTSPSGTVHTLVSRVGRIANTGFGDSSDFGGTYTFADGGASLWAAAADGGASFIIPAGTYHTTSAGGTSAPAATSMNAAFAGQNGNGTWTLIMSDIGAGDFGAITGWQLTIVPAPGAAAVLGLGGLLAARRRR